MRQIDALVVERPWDVILWHITRMGGWLHLVTVFLTLCKWMGILHLHWWVVFLPSLLYGTLVILLAVGGSTIFALCRWIDSPDQPTPAFKEFFSSPIAAGFSSKRDKAA